MPRTKIRRKGALSKYRPPEMDEAAWYDLFDILHETIFNGNWSATARALDVSTNTAKKWSEDAPKRGWELHNLHSTVKELVPYMMLSKHKKIREQAKQVMIQLRKRGLQKLTKLAEDLEAQTVNHDDARTYVLSEIAWNGKRTLSIRDLNFFAPSTIRAVAQEIGLQVVRAGQGQDHTTWYRIPHPDELQKDDD